MSARHSRRKFLAASLAAGCAPAMISVRGLQAASRSVERDVDWLDEVQRAPLEIPGDVPALTPLLTDENGKPIDTLAAWRVRREQLRGQWLKFLGAPAAQRSPEHPPKLKVLEEENVGDVVRQRVAYEVEPQIVTEAYILSPAQRGAPCPGVAVFHSTVDHSIRQPAGVEGRPEKAFGLRLAQRGCVAICPRNYLWPANSAIAASEEAQAFLQRRPNVKGMAKMLHDAQVAVDILAQLPAVDADRLGCVGHSLGAKETLYLAAFDERIKTTVSSEGGIGIGYSNWDAPWYLSAAVQQPDFAREHHELLALAAPRPFLLLGGDSADGDRSWPFIAAALPVYKLYGDRPRLGLFNHKQGHAVPPQAEQRIYQWFDAYL